MAAASLVEPRKGRQGTQGEGSLAGGAPAGVQPGQAGHAGCSPGSAEVGKQDR